MKVKPDLSGVPETALWTLWFRALASRLSDDLLKDPMALGLVERIDYPFAERFGKGFQLQPQIQALRALTFDAQVRRFLRDHPHGTVVALGEGLETQFWRVDNGSMTWLTVDLPESVALRRQLLPWMAKAVLRLTAPFRPPPLLWTLRPGQLSELAAIDPAIERVVDVRPAPGFGLIGWLAPRLRRVPIIGPNRPVIVALHFRG